MHLCTTSGQKNCSFQFSETFFSIFFLRPQRPTRNECKYGAGGQEQKKKQSCRGRDGKTASALCVCERVFLVKMSNFSLLTRCDNWQMMNFSWHRRANPLAGLGFSVWNSFSLLEGHVKFIRQTFFLSSAVDNSNTHGDWERKPRFPYETE